MDASSVKADEGFATLHPTGSACMLFSSLLYLLLNRIIFQFDLLTKDSHVYPNTEYIYVRCFRPRL